MAAATRRWTRKTLASGLPAYAGSFPARVIEVSHGGLRFEIERLPGQYLPLVFSVTLPMADLRVGVEVAWKKNRSGTAHWVCGASVSENRPLWRGFVDSLPADGLSPAR